MPARPVRAVAFDFNGTLSDDEPILLSVYQELFAERGRPLTAETYFATLAGNTEEFIIATWLDVDGDELAVLMERRIEGYLERCRDGSTISAAARQAVSDAAARVPVTVVSGAFRREIAPVLAGAGIDRHVSFIVTADDVERGKPDPECYLLAASQLGISPAELVAFEDTEAGVASAKGAGAYCVARRRDAPARAPGRSRRARGRTRPGGRLEAPPLTLVIAHRGACWELPENTLAAFERAIELGADFVEFDVHATSDGELVVCHDRPRGGELRLAEAMAAIAGRIGIMCELKSPWRYRRHDVVARSVALLPEDAIVLSFDPRALRAVRGRRVLQHVGFGVSIQSAARYAWGVGFNDRRVTRRGLGKARRLGLVSTVYTVNEPERMRELVDLGADGIFSDRPDLLRRCWIWLLGKAEQPSAGARERADNTVADRVRLRMGGRQVGGELAVAGRTGHPQARDRAEKDLRDDLPGERPLSGSPRRQPERYSTVSGRTSTSTRSPFGSPRAASTVSRWPAYSTTPSATTVDASRFIVPMNSATNGVAGAPYISTGVPIWSMRPSWRTATRSEIARASSWS